MRNINFNDQISKNKRLSFFLMFFVFLIILLIGYVISFAFSPGYFFIILILAVIFSLSYILISYYKSDKIALASVHAQKADRTKYGTYNNIVEGLALASGLPKPRLYIMKEEQVNAFASGRDPQHAVICVTTGALDKLNRGELEGVLAHEMGHIASYDIRFMTLVSVMVGLVVIISEIFLRSLWFGGGNRDNKNFIFIIIGIALAILAPIIVKLIQLSISRKREFSADASSVKFTRNPNELIKALTKIKEENEPTKKVSKALSPMFFTNPFKGLSRTHPPIEKRIAVLRRM